MPIFSPRRQVGGRGELPACRFICRAASSRFIINRLATGDESKEGHSMPSVARSMPHVIAVGGRPCPAAWKARAATSGLPCARSAKCRASCHPRRRGYIVNGFSQLSRHGLVSATHRAERRIANYHGLFRADLLRWPFTTKYAR